MNDQVGKYKKKGKMWAKIIFNTVFTVLIFAAAYKIALPKTKCVLKRENLSGQVAIVTGANTGIGIWSAKLLAEMGAKVVLACRSLQKAEKAKEWIEENSHMKGLKLVPMQLDLSDFESVIKFAQDFEQTEMKLNILMNNAGVGRISSDVRYTKQGLEETMGVNHFGHFLLTERLLKLLKKEGSKARIINVSALAHMFGSGDFVNNLMGVNVSGVMQYINSKIANILFTKELQERLEGTGICTYSLHPGVIKTELTRDLPSFLKPVQEVIANLFLLTAEEGSFTQVMVASDPSLQNVCGKYWDDCAITEEAHFAKDPALAKKLWRLTEEIISQKLSSK